MPSFDLVLAIWQDRRATADHRMREPGGCHGEEEHIGTGCGRRECPTQSVKVDGGQSTEIGGTQTIVIGKVRQVAIAASDSLSLGLDQTVAVGRTFSVASAPAAFRV